MNISCLPGFHPPIYPLYVPVGALYFNSLLPIKDNNGDWASSFKDLAVKLGSETKC